MTPLRVLVVCTANQCRSPLAEVILRELLDDRGVSARVRSAGTDAVEGVEATDKSAELARRRGLDLGDHRSHRITKEDVEDADLIITMETRHAAAIVHEWPQVTHTTFAARDLAARAAAGPRDADTGLDDWLRSASDDRPVRSLLDRSTRNDIHDPIGRSMRVYKRCERDLEEVLGTIVDGLFPDTPDD